MKRSDYLNINSDNFPENMDIIFDSNNRQKILRYKKQQWNNAGLRYGDNPDQEAACYALDSINGTVFDNFANPELSIIKHMEFLHGAKQPSKTNITDINTALEILRYFAGTPTAVIVKHNNPSSVASAADVEEAFTRAYAADCIAAFGGVLCVNCKVTEALAQELSAYYFEVIAAPSYESAAINCLTKKKNLRIIALHAMDVLAEYNTLRYLDFSALMDGSIIVQQSFLADYQHILDAPPAQCTRKEKKYHVHRPPSPKERQDMIFGWCVQSAISSNSIIYVKDRCTVGISTGEQDRVGAASIARDKAYRNKKEYLALTTYNNSFAQLIEAQQEEIEEEVRRTSAGLNGAVVISDGFFPFRDGLDVALKEGVQAVLQPGGSIQDCECIKACNEYDASMVFTKQRGFRH